MNLDVFERDGAGAGHKIGDIIFDLRRCSARKDQSNKCRQHSDPGHAFPLLFLGHPLAKARSLASCFFWLRRNMHAPTEYRIRRHGSFLGQISFCLTNTLKENPALAYKRVRANLMAPHSEAGGRFPVLPEKQLSPLAWNENFRRRGFFYHPLETSCISVKCAPSRKTIVRPCAHSRTAPGTASTIHAGRRCQKIAAR